MTPRHRAEVIRELGRQANLEAVGYAAAGPLPHGEYVSQWLQRGWHGQMEYLRRHHAIRMDARRLLPGARTVIVAAQSYRAAMANHSAEEESAGNGRVARYAWGEDYHRVLRGKLRQWVARMREALNEPFEARICVDTAPIVEREWAAAAGVGWIGKNTLVLNRQLGSYFFLGLILTTLEIEPSPPAENHCGTCTRCLKACPTGALVAPHQMDARRCISYLTIEHRGEIDPAMKPSIGNWAYGCDSCQEVCPYNRKAPTTREAAYQPLPSNPLVPRMNLAAVLNSTDEQHQQWVAGSAMDRATREMLCRNACIVRDNQNRRAMPESTS